VSERGIVKIRFCASESVDRGEGILGTATESRCYLLVECGGAWPSKVAEILDAPGISLDLSDALKRFIEWCPETVHPLLIRQPGGTGSSRVYVLRAETASGRCLQYEGDLADDFFVVLQDAYSHPLPIGDIALVCTHGKRDKCCAKFGEPVYDRLRSELRDDFEVFQCSHVGGDRFAANVVWLPYGTYLGHVHTGLEAVADKLKSNAIPLQWLRGNSAFPSATQYFEGHLRRELGIDRPKVFELHAYEEVDRNGELFCFTSLRDTSTGEIYTAYVLIFRSASRVLASCNMDAEANPRVFKLIDELTFKRAVSEVG
jgi:hypothetical protein